jgi:hypothetical protein
MSTPAQPSPSSSGGDHPVSAEQIPVQPGFEEKLAKFWEQNQGKVIGLCVLILVVIVGRHGWDWLQGRRKAQVAAAYAAAGNDTQLKAFAEENSGAPLGGVAQLRLADEAYTGGRYSEALSAYRKAQGSLAKTALGGRVQLGIAISTLKSGDTEAGKTALQQVANDANLSKSVRAEAAYHLATLAAAAGATEEVSRHLELINSIEATGMWAQRGMMLRNTLPQLATPPAAANGDAPTVSFPGSRP